MSEATKRVIEYLHKENEELKAKCDLLEKALDKACTELLEWVKSCGANNTGEMNGVYPFDTKEQWKEWLLHE